MNQLKILLFILLIGTATPLLMANLPPVVSNATAQQRTDGSKIVDIYFDVEDAESDTLTITLSVSDDESATFTISPDSTNLSGDIGYGVIPGTGRHIIWSAGDETQIFDASTFVFKITADDHSLPVNWVYVQGGTFQMGQTGLSEPVHTVTVSDFAVCVHEVTQAEWLETMGSNPSSHQGSDNLPVDNINCYSAFVYCNQRSIDDGLTPCYTIGGSTDPADWGVVPTSQNAAWDAMTCDWNADGYRLLTEAEWEFAARGGNQSQGYIYSGSDNPDDVAWYTGNSGNQSHEVMTKAPNELGIHDMCGNMWEYGWDWYADAYMPGPQNNPTGPTTGQWRLLRGGTFSYTAPNIQIAYRNYQAPMNTHPTFGLRVGRSMEPRQTMASNWAIIEGGIFEMGSNLYPNDNCQPVHTVTLSTFAMCIHEVTQAEFTEIMGYNPSYHVSSNCPVEFVKYYEATYYCNLRSIDEGLEPCYSLNGSTDPYDWGSFPTTYNNLTWDTMTCDYSANGYRLPTEAEWEFAARGGNLSQGYQYSGGNDANVVGWYNGNSGGNSHAVMQKAPNELGLYDMSGNVYEMCTDWYSPTYYSVSPQNNPAGPDGGTYRSMRSSSWINSSEPFPPECRSGVYPGVQNDTIGFRVVRGGF